MKKILALLLAVMMVLALCACGDAEETPAPAEEAAPAVDAAPAVADAAAPAVEGAASGEPAVEGAASGEPAAADTAAAGDLEAYKAYCLVYVQAGAPTEEQRATAVAAIEACTTVEEVESSTYLYPMFSYEMIMTYADWVAAGCPAADTSNMEEFNPAASGEAAA